MNKHLELQKEFQEIFLCPVLNFGEIPTIERRKLRLALALEELTELAEAFGLEITFINLLNKQSDDLSKKYNKDSERFSALDTIDALTDIEVINNGTILECGMQDIFENAYIAVDESNKSKALDTEQQAQDVIDNYIFEGKETEYLYSNGKYLVRFKTGKIAKPIGYYKDAKPILETILENKRRQL